jgi:HCOMODA/2-hydroxy-3-carboxy-muconic semialdehyde decarboxylase
MGARRSVAGFLRGGPALRLRNEGYFGFACTEAAAGGGRRRREDLPVPDRLADLRYDVALANRILAHEGVLDAFGHVSVRHPDDPKRYLLSRSRAPELVEPGDILEYTLDSVPVREPGVPLYSERVIHGEIYKARPEVFAVCHHHAPAFMPLCITRTDYVPVFHLGATGGRMPPFWDQRDEFGDTNLLVVKPEEGASLARALGKHQMVLMVRHGVTVVGSSVQDLVFRCYYSCRNAEFQTQATNLGPLGPLSAGEIEKAGSIATATTGQARAWEYWTVRLQKRGGMPPRAPSARGTAAGKRADTERKRATTNKAKAKRRSRR